VRSFFALDEKKLLSILLFATRMFDAIAFRVLAEFFECRLGRMCA